MAIIIFDLDGTLIDSAPDIHATVLRLFAELGLPPLPFDAVKSFIGNGLRVLLEKSLKEVGATLSDDAITALLPRAEAIYAAAQGDGALYPGAKAALQDLARHHRLGLCTNKPQGPAQASLVHFGLQGLFETVIGGDSLAQRKPDPAPLLRAVTDLGGDLNGDAAQAEILYVGDSEVDEETAARAGIPFVIYTEGYRRTPLSSLRFRGQFSDHHALPDLIAGLLQDPCPGPRPMPQHSHSP